MLMVLEFVQLILYIPLLALLGQGALYVLAGARREGNFFYQTLRLLARPVTYVVRRLTPSKVDDRHVPVIAFSLLLLLSFVIFAERGYLTCIEMGYQDCRR